MPALQIPKKLKPLLKPKRYKIIIGGRGSAKSMTFADLALLKMQTENKKIACFREYQNSIDDSVYALMCEEVARLKLAGFQIQTNRLLLNNEEVAKFKGLARNPEGIKSMFGFEIFWVEEAQTISYRSLKALTPTLRTENSEIWMSANPKSRADPFSQRFIIPYEKQLLKNGYYEDDMHIIIVCNYTDNPFFPSVLEQERKHDEENLSKAEYNHIWLGHFYDEIKGSIIPVDWFDAAIDAHEKLGFKASGAKIASHDPSDSGDAKGYCLRHGSVILDLCDTEEGDVNEACDWALNKAIDAQADYFTWDCDGLGISLKRQVHEALKGKKVEAVIYKGSEGVKNPTEIYQAVEGESRQRAKNNKETFKNNRAQYYWYLRDRFYNAYRAVVKREYVDPDKMISLSSEIRDLDRIRSEVCRIPKKPNANGHIQIMTKKEMAGLDIPSPNMADALMQTMLTPQPARAGIDLDFAGWGQ